MDKILGAVIIEGIVLTIVMFVVVMLYMKYNERRRPAALALAIAFTFWDIAIICLFIFRILFYLQSNGLANLPPNTEVMFDNIGINLGYGFSALSNIFIITFVALIFSQSPLFRHTKLILPIIFGVLNGITVGIIIGSTIRDWPTPQYGFEPTMYHLAITFLTFIFLVVFTIRPLRQAEFRWEKAGFRFIILSGVFGFLIYLSFALDFVLGDGGLNIIPDGYTPAFFFAYIFAILMCVFAYFGYVMPKYLRDLFKEK